MKTSQWLVIAMAAAVAAGGFTVTKSDAAPGAGPLIQRRGFVLEHVKDTSGPDSTDKAGRQTRLKRARRRRLPIGRIAGADGGSSGPYRARGSSGVPPCFSGSKAWPWQVAGAV